MGGKHPPKSSICSWAFPCYKPSILGVSKPPYFLLQHPNGFQHPLRRFSRRICDSEVFQVQEEINGIQIIVSRLIQFLNLSAVCHVEMCRAYACSYPPENEGKSTPEKGTMDSKGKCSLPTSIFRGKHVSFRGSSGRGCPIK